MGRPYGTVKEYYSKDKSSEHRGYKTGYYLETMQ
jgi:hypothetical protein